MKKFEICQSCYDDISNNKKSEIKISTKEELKEMLKKYKDILNKSMIEYLDSLIELEFSIIKDIINDDEKDLLSELEIYKEIANYNITKRALNLFEDKKIDTVIKQDEENLCIYGNIGRDSILLFGYDYIGSENNENKDIGKISLYKTINSVEQIEKEINRINSILNALEKEKNPYKSISNVYEGPAVTWLERHDNQIKMYEDKLEKIKGKTELTEKDKEEIEITNMINKLMLEDYNLKSDDFKENQAYKRSSTEQTELYKRYVKQVPKIIIKNNIKYV